MSPASNNQAQAPWRPSASHQTLLKRASLLKKIRTYFANQSVLEVETPLLSHMQNLDPWIKSIPAQYQAYGRASKQLYLKTSAESHMKRLLCAYHGSIYQVSKVFRDSEAGTNHNPEFSMLEWYRVDYSLFDMMDDLVGLLQFLGVKYNLIKISYRELFIQFCDIDPFALKTRDLKKLLRHHSIQLVDKNLSLSRDTCLDIILSHIIQPQFKPDEGYLIYHYPKSQAALALVDEQCYGSTARRFEFYLGQLEIANAYEELRDASEQAKRLNTQGIRDAHLIAALSHGLPKCAGTALGIDRLLMHLADAHHIKEVLSFHIDNA